MVRNEGSKLAKCPYVWGLLFVCVILNIIFFLYGNGEEYAGKEYKELWQTFLSGGQSISEEMKQIQEEQQKYKDNGMEAKELLYTRFLQELNSVETYAGYREGILANARKMSLFSSFSGDSFARRNVEKTAEHFRQMKPVQVTTAPSLGVEKFFSPVTAALELIFLMFLGYLLFIQESENGIRGLLYVTRHGKARLFGAKIGAHILYMFIATVVMYGCNFLLLHRQYGLGDLGRSVQSVLAYRSCGSILSVGGFLLAGIAVMLYLFAALSVVIDFLCVWGKKTIYSALLILLCAAASMILYLQIPINSALGWLKYLNPVFCLDAGEVVGKYVNLNLFGNPVTYLLAIILTYALMTAICFVLSCRRFCRVPTDKGKRTFLRRFSVGKTESVPNCHLSLFRYEAFKIRKGGHVCLVLLFFLVLSIVFSYQDKLIFDDEDEYYYYSYMQGLAGKRTEEKSAYIRQEQERFQKIKEKQDKLLLEGNTDALMVLVESLRPYRGFRRVVERENYLNENQLDAFVYEGGYKKLTDWKENRDNRILMLLGMFLLVFSLCSVFALDKENGQELLLQITRHGKVRRTRKKIFCAAIICVLSFVIVYLPQFYVFCRLYGLAEAGESIRCMQMAGWSGMELPIWAWLLGQYVLRLLFMVVFGGIVLAFSAKLKNVFMTIVSLSLLILVIGFCIL